MSADRASFDMGEIAELQANEGSVMRRRSLVVILKGLLAFAACAAFITLMWWASTAIKHTEDSKLTGAAYVAIVMLKIFLWSMVFLPLFCNIGILVLTVREVQHLTDELEEWKSHWFNGFMMKTMGGGDDAERGMGIISCGRKIAKCVLVALIILASFSVVSAMCLMMMGY
eukprot:TRINITY_DN6055_c0_g1_i1.p1 TRINITY_DN6055_c0_g1~~TRINITY_DN6055_c0_g1_i1.p1  ORF type:complete len:198 (-),score=33.40 TRINITY_DN6055_c0_g1_i1:97-609(-)